MANNFRSLILKRILSHGRETRKTLLQNTFDDCQHILQKMNELTTLHKSRLSCSLGITSRIKIQSKNVNCSLRCHDLTEKSCSQPKEVHLAKQTKELYLQAATKEEGIRTQNWYMFSAPFISTWKQHHCTSREHTFYGIPGSMPTQEQACFAIRNAQNTHHSLVFY